MTLKDKAAIVGVAATPYYRRGQSLPQTPLEVAGKATVVGALTDAAPGDVHVGLPVELVWRDVRPDVTVPTWRPT